MSFVQNLADIAQAVGASTLGDGGYRLDFADGSSRRATQVEITAAQQAAQAEEAKQAEATTARDDAKRALSALDTIITGIDGATLTQAKTAIKQLAQIQKHINLATRGR